MTRGCRHATDRTITRRLPGGAREPIAMSTIRARIEARREGPAAPRDGSAVQPSSLVPQATFDALMRGLHAQVA
ncbi:hypothetical protein WS70_23920 [Burkholderia mayonis]|uniref:Uncharacterized protein n=1 Tax=Burkholderia mayonis TaxID=1385591 RepID=A0A1B4FM94_9BURK|nr:hypothetical protein WS70_23920 [Burkholderia mayonis]